MIPPNVVEPPEQRISALVGLGDMRYYFVDSILEILRQGPIKK